MSSSKDSIEIKPIGLKDYTCKQSRFSHVPKVPLRMILLAPSGSGKTVLISNLILNIYKGCFERIFIFSPSVHLDQTWSAVKKYQEDVMKVSESDKETLYFDYYDADDLENIIDTQHKVTKHIKDSGKKKLFSILIVVDDFADSVEVSRHSKLLHALFTRGRHHSISTIVSSQKYNALATIIRVNATALIVYRLRNYAELEVFLTENGALIDKKSLLEIYREATKEPYSFLYVNLTARNIKEMFYQNFTHLIEIEDD